MLKLRRFLWLGLSVVAMGCGGKEPAKSPATVVAERPAEREEAPDLSRVAAPKELIVYARFAKPEAAVETIAQWANLPLRVRSLLPPNLQGLDKIVAWNAPVEAAVALDPLGEGRVPQPLAVFSVGLTSLDGALEFARRQGDPAPRVRAGVYRLEDSGPLSCMLSVALGTAPARLICGKRRKDVETLTPFAARGLAAQPLSDADLEITFLAEPLQKRYASEIAGARMLVGLLLRQLQLDSPRFDRALSDAAYGLVDELVAISKDVDQIRMEGKIDSKLNALDLTMSASFKGSSSWTVQVQKDWATRVTPPPPELFKMPADATMAGFSVYPKPELFTPLNRTTSELVEGFLEHKKVAPKAREEWKRALDNLFRMAGSTVVYARGSLPGPLPTEKERLAVQASLGGWGVWASSQDAKQLEATITSVMNVITSRDLPRVFEDLQLKPADLPKYRAKALNVPGFKNAGKLYELTLTDAIVRAFDDEAIAARMSGAGDDAPTDKKPDAGKAQKPFKIPVFIALISDGPWTWIGTSTDQKLLVEKLKVVRDDKAAALATRAGLDDVKKTASVSGGFISLRYILDSLAASRESKLIGVHDKLPAHGETPIPFASTITAGSATTTTVTLRVPDKVVADLAALFMHIGPSLR